MSINLIKYSFLLLLIPALHSAGQTISDDRVRDQFRAGQLLGQFDKGQSMSISPNRMDVRDLDSALGIQTRKPLFSSGKFQLSLVSATIDQQYNSTLPYDWNLGAMIPAAGYQSVVRVGAFARVGKHITIQLAPEFVQAENKPFETFGQELGDAAWASYYRFLNTSDLPEKFGNNRYSKVLPGQSSIRYNTDQFSFGISTENCWWGPGYRNALVMSTNAPGFLHATFNTRKPLQTPIGSFEGEVIAGTLSNSGILPPRINSVDPQGNFVYEPKPSGTRYITGMVLVWQPKWTPHLFLGISKASYLYSADISNPLDALPLQGFFGKAITKNEGNGKKLSMGSLFFRYVMPAEHAELYFELGRKDASLMPWNVVQSPQYRRAYVAGLRKLFPSANNSHIQLTAELTQMQAPTADLIHNPDSWYTDRFVRQGYTNMGKSIGAGIGPGSNSQTLEISWVKGLKKIGLQFERLRHNSDFYYYAFEPIGDFRRHWIDISTTLNAEWNFHRFFVSGQFSVIRSFNHEWFIVQYDPNNYFIPGNEILNFTGRLGVSYRW